MSMERVTTIDLFLSPVSGNINSRDVSQLGPFFQGALMELIDSEYAARLHHAPFNPYSQYVVWDELTDALRWRVCALNSEAAGQFLQPLQGISSIALRARDVTFEVERIQIEYMPLKRLTDEIYMPHETRISVKFLTPTAFKSKGEYIIVPTARLMFQNLLMRYEQVYSNSKEIDFETVEYLDSHTRISSYGLRSKYFANVGEDSKRIPAFIGGITLSVSGSQIISGLARMLLLFGSYSGIGIKTSMGMGAMEVATQSASVGGEANKPCRVQ